MKKTRIGLLGGTFDPVHNAHIRLAEETQSQMKLDRVLFIPAKIHALKKNEHITEAGHRLKMLELALDGYPDFQVCDVELSRDGISYTVDTLRLLKEKPEYSNSDLFLIIGADNLRDLFMWKEPLEIVKLCTICVFDRPNAFISPDNGMILSKIEKIKAPLMRVSATEIRNKIQDGIPWEKEVPAAVADYINEYNLYR